MGVKSGSQLPPDALVSALLRLYPKQQVYINRSGVLAPSFPFSPLLSCYSPNTSVSIISFPLIMAFFFSSVLYSTFSTSCLSQICPTLFLNLTLHALSERIFRRLIGISLLFHYSDIDSCWSFSMGRATDFCPLVMFPSNCQANFK